MFNMALIRQMSHSTAVPYGDEVIPLLGISHTGPHPIVRKADRVCNTTCGLTSLGDYYSVEL